MIRNRLIRCITVLALGATAGSISLQPHYGDSTFHGWWTEGPGMSSSGTLVHVRGDGTYLTNPSNGGTWAEATGTWSEFEGHITFRVAGNAATYDLRGATLVLIGSNVGNQESRWVRTRAP